jgi:hypothetical protein
VVVSRGVQRVIRSLNSFDFFPPFGRISNSYGRMFYYYLRGIIKENPLDKEADYYMNEMKRMYYHFY